MRKGSGPIENPEDNYFTMLGETLMYVGGTGYAQTLVTVLLEVDMKILLAIDGSPCSDAAVAEVARRPWPEGSSVKVLTAIEIPMPPTPEAWAIPLTYFEEMDLALRKQGQNIVDGAIQKLKSNKTFTADAVLAPGSPRHVILDEAENWGADLIVLGSHGYGALKRFLLGSVSQAVVSHAKCSVEVVRCLRIAETFENQIREIEKE